MLSPSTETFLRINYIYFSLHYVSFPVVLTVRKFYDSQIKVESLNARPLLQKWDPISRSVAEPKVQHQWMICQFGSLKTV